MKILIVMAILLLLSGCHASVSNDERVSAQTIPTVNSSATNNSSSTPNNESGDQRASGSPDERFKIAPDNFKKVDFTNHPFPYRFSYGKKAAVALKNGKYEYDVEEGRGWFNLEDVYYADLTGDGGAEAIVMLWHVSCGASCNGGAGLFYIYAVDRNKLKPIWQYETGSMAYGCGLKSFTARSGEITLELFGRCDNETETSSVTGKFQVEDTTRLTFRFDGRQFIERNKEIIPTPERSVLNYQPEISIGEW